jgi:hypothetical protein
MQAKIHAAIIVVKKSKPQPVSNHEVTTEQPRRNHEVTTLIETTLKETAFKETEDIRCPCGQASRVSENTSERERLESLIRKAVEIGTAEALRQAELYREELKAIVAEGQP